jgi:hypothetical protein
VPPSVSEPIAMRKHLDLQEGGKTMADTVTVPERGLEHRFPLAAGRPGDLLRIHGTPPQSRGGRLARRSRAAIFGSIMRAVILLPLLAAGLALLVFGLVPALFLALILLLVGVAPILLVTLGILLTHGVESTGDGLKRCGRREELPRGARPRYESGASENLQFSS